MTKGRTRRLVRSPAVLFVAFVTVLGLTGLVTAFWIAQSPVQGQVNTGAVGLQWAWAGTDDDGWIFNDTSGDDRDFDCPNGTVEELFDWNEAEDCTGQNGWQGSGADPMEPYPYGGDGLDRYDKDVGNCWADAQGDRLQFGIDNGYPSYYCSVGAELVGGGSVPVMTAGVTYDESTFQRVEYRYVDGNREPYDGPVCYWDNLTPGDDSDDFEYAEQSDPNFDGDCNNSSYDPSADPPDFPVYQVEDAYALRVMPEDGYLSVYEGRDLVLTIWYQDACGFQVDPQIGGEQDQGEQAQGEHNFYMSVHVEEFAQQNSNYVFELMAQGVNWNEWAEYEAQVEPCGPLD